MAKALLTFVLLALVFRVHESDAKRHEDVGEDDYERNRIEDDHVDPDIRGDREKDEGQQGEDDENDRENLDDDRVKDEEHEGPKTYEDHRYLRHHRRRYPYAPKQDFPVWRGLAVTYGRFTKMPMNARIASRNGWQLDLDGCKLDLDGCKKDLFFVGRRYVFTQRGNKKNWDRATLLIYDARGHIAGIQMEIPANYTFTQTNRIPPFVGYDGKHYLTAYFTDPTHICDRKHKRDRKMVGDRLLILDANTTLPKGRLLPIPLRENWIDTSVWKKGGCVPGMGRHYFYNLSENMDCADFWPIFLLYNKNVLNGFGWTMSGHIVSATSRLEHAPVQALDIFFKPHIKFPKCLLVKTKSVTSQHVFLDIDPKTRNRC